MAVFGLPPLPGRSQSTGDANAQETNTPVASHERGQIARKGPWSRSSRTFVQPDGTNQTQVFAGQVNFKTEAGTWEAIDNTLVADEDGSGWENSANDYSVELPADLSAGPVDVQEGQSWVKYELEGASAVGTKDEAIITYDEALPGVDLTVEAGNEIVKEDLVLSGPDSVSSFVYDISYSSDVSPRMSESGGIDFVRANGDIPFLFAAPYMTDGAGVESTAVTMELLSGDSQVRVSADEAWLEDPSRVWP